MWAHCRLSVAPLASHFDYNRDFWTLLPPSGEIRDFHWIMLMIFPPRREEKKVCTLGMGHCPAPTPNHSLGQKAQKIWAKGKGRQAGGSAHFVLLILCSAPVSPFPTCLSSQVPSPTSHYLQAHKSSLTSSKASSTRKPKTRKDAFGKRKGCFSSLTLPAI